MTTAVAEQTPALEHASAVTLDGRIRRMAESTGRHLDELAALVTQAKAGRIHEALGYASWPAYLAYALAPLCSAKGRQARREIVAYLAEHGMSVRAIAAATGTAKSTVADDLRVSENRTPDGARVIGLDGKRQRRQHQTSKRGRAFTLTTQRARLAAKIVRTIDELQSQADELIALGGDEWDCGDELIEKAQQAISVGCGLTSLLDQPAQTPTAPVR
ncbi:hypothetical protein DQP58_16315 [Mycobacterium colombiense]|uniref:Helix-turn-helix domain containing protein n=1 Tax=Mycobacterium colombiense TaxID=339268 RepID=A0A329KDT0_9MYCO|nr:hypothetical protein [Mycobacterium colombiense]RAU93513.1 hypothetical protein DQP58_16315 [Mycobacterium colombiense]